MPAKYPFSILPPPLVDRLAKKAIGLGNTIYTFYPGIKLQLLQAENDTPPRQYAAAALVIAAGNFIALFALLAAVGAMTRSSMFTLALGIAAVVAVASFYTVLFYPGVLAKKKTRAVEANLIPALRQLLIELKSGVPLFNAMSSVSSGYGGVSLEFRQIVKQINGGVADTDALNDAAKRNQSFQFRRAIWQISNALKVGSDVGTALEGLIADLTQERVAEIRRYGQELSPWTMIYMLAAVVLPSLGITFAIVIMSFLNLPLPGYVFLLFLAFLVIFQTFFINFVKSRRPAAEGA